MPMQKPVRKLTSSEMSLRRLEAQAKNLAIQLTELGEAGGMGILQGYTLSNCIALTRRVETHLQDLRREMAKDEREKAK